MLQAHPNHIRVQVEMSMERLQQAAQHRALLQQAGIEPQPRRLREVRRLLGMMVTALVLRGAGLKRLGALAPGPATGSLDSA